MFSHNYINFKCHNRVHVMKLIHCYLVLNMHSTYFKHRIRQLRWTLNRSFSRISEYTRHHIIQNIRRHCSQATDNKTRLLNLLAQLQMLLNLNVEVSVSFLLGKMALEADNCRLS